MPIHNSEIAAKFRKLADLLEIEGANLFWGRAYQRHLFVGGAEDGAFWGVPDWAQLA